MGLRFGWCALKCLGGAIFWLSVLGLLSGTALVAWGHHLDGLLGDHLGLGMPGRRYLFPGALGLAALLTLPVHLYGLAIKAKVVKTLASRRWLRKCPAHGKSLSRLLCVYVVLSGLSGLLVFLLCVGSAVLWNQSRRGMKPGLALALRRYSSDRAIKLQVDWMQMQLHCCGAASYADWFHVPWQAAEDMPPQNACRGRRRSSKCDQSTDGRGRGQLLSADVPFSCCSPGALQACVHHDVAGVGGEEVAARLSIATEGCQAKLLGRGNATSQDVLVCLISLSIYQVMLCILSRLLQTALQSVLRADAKGKYFDAWVFGRASSSKGTVRDAQVGKSDESDAQEAPAPPSLAQSARSDGQKCAPVKVQMLQEKRPSPRKKRAEESPYMQMRRQCSDVRLRGESNPSRSSSSGSPEAAAPQKQALASVKRTRSREGCKRPTVLFQKPSASRMTLPGSGDEDSTSGSSSTTPLLPPSSSTHLTSAAPSRKPGCPPARRHARVQCNSGCPIHGNGPQTEPR